MTLAIAIRPARDEDRDFIISSYLKSQRREGANKHKTSATYFRSAKSRVDMLTRGQLLVACNPHDEWQIFGWLAGDGELLHYVYVKFPFRGAGVARRLFEAWNPARRATVVTHTGRAFAAVRERYRLSFDDGALEERR